MPLGLLQFSSVQFRENGEPEPKPTEWFFRSSLGFGEVANPNQTKRISEFRFTEVHEPKPGFTEVCEPEPRFTEVCDHGPGASVYCVDNGTQYI